MISKLTHFLKYGIIGCILGAVIEVLANMDNPVFITVKLMEWAAIGTILGLLYSIVIEKWFNETYHD